MMQYDTTGQYSPEAVSCYQQYLSISRNYIDNHFVNMSESEREQYWMAEQPFVTDCFRLESKAPGLLYDVALYSKAVLLQMGRDFKDGMTVAERKKALSSIRINWKQVRAKLPADGCAIEFIVYEKNSEDHIGAIVLNKRSLTPVFIDIAPLTRVGIATCLPRSSISVPKELFNSSIFSDCEIRSSPNFASVQCAEFHASAVVIAVLHL
jgi:hypothetical protein